MVAADVDILDSEIENTYRLLTEEDVTGGMRTQIETSLEREGVDLKQLCSDMVAHQSVHTYLTKVCDVKRRDKETYRIEKTVSVIRRLKNRVTAVVERDLDGRLNTEQIALGESNVVVQAQAYCKRCDSQYKVSDLLSRNGCQCED